MLELFEVFATNQAAALSPVGEQLLGRPLTQLQDFIATKKGAFAKTIKAGLVIN
jgi:NAD(P)H dehydrogenase (quinone)